MGSVIYVGFSSRARAGWQGCVQAPEAPSNYKDETKKNEYVIRARAKQEAEAADNALTGQLIDVVLLDEDGFPVAYERSQLLEVLKESTRVVCCRWNVFRRLAVTQAIDTHKVLPRASRWLLSRLAVHDDVLQVRSITAVLGPEMIYDPVEVLVGSTAEDATDPGLIIARFPLIGPTTKLQKRPETAEEWAVFARAVDKLIVSSE